MANSETPAPRVCRGCGCTDEDGCLVLARSGVAKGQLRESYTGCWWVADDLCSGCAYPQRRVRGPRVDHRAAPAQ